MIEGESTAGVFFTRYGRLPQKGMRVVTHRHNYDHITLILGAATYQQLEATNPEETEFRVVRETRMSRGGQVYVVAGQLHAIVADEDNVEYWCTFNHRDEEGVLCDQFTGWPRSYG